MPRSPAAAAARIPRRVPSGAIVYLGFVLVFVVFAITLRDTVPDRRQPAEHPAPDRLRVDHGVRDDVRPLGGRDRPLHRRRSSALSAMVTAVLLRDANVFVAVPAGLLVGSHRRPRQRPAHDPAARPLVPDHPGHGGHHRRARRAGSPSLQPGPGPQQQLHRTSSARATSGRSPRCSCGPSRC